MMGSEYSSDYYEDGPVDRQVRSSSEPVVVREKVVQFGLSEHTLGAACVLQPAGGKFKAELQPVRRHKISSITYETIPEGQCVVARTY